MIEKNFFIESNWNLMKTQISLEIERTRTFFFAMNETKHSVWIMVDAKKMEPNETFGIDIYKLVTVLDNIKVETIVKTTI